jgi:hypothetical protein
MNDSWLLDESRCDEHEGVSIDAGSASALKLKSVVRGVQHLDLAGTAPICAQWAQWAREHKVRV